MNTLTDWIDANTTACEQTLEARIALRNLNRIANFTGIKVPQTITDHLTKYAAKRFDWLPPSYVEQRLRIHKLT